MVVGMHAEPLVVELSSQLQPWDCLQRLSHWPYLLFLDSSSQHPELGRYSYITADPFHVHRAAGRLEILNAFQEAHNLWQQWKQPHQASLPPFQGGLAGLWGYGVNQAFERIPSTRWHDFDVPDLVLGWFDWVIAFDHAKKQTLLISQGLPAESSCERLEKAELRADRVVQALGKPIVSRQPHQWTCKIDRSKLAPCFPLEGHPQVISNFTRDAYRRSVQQAIDYTHAGDCFQVNLSQRLLMPWNEDPLQLYQQLRCQSPAQCAGYFDMGEYVLASSSPERFIQIQSDGIMESRPIKGTRPRGTTIQADQQLAAELLASKKDHAENVMIVDLLRNDLGRVAEYGTIRVPEICKLESNTSVHHLVSSVTGQLRQSLSPFDVLAATLPGGSITGAPKVRAMEIIAELEPTSRGAYCGCLGYISFTGTMDTNILIRTMTMGQGWVQFPVGGGIVADSDPDAEYAETLHKARGMLAALE